MQNDTALFSQMHHVCRFGVVTALLATAFSLFITRCLQAAPRTSANYSITTEVEDSGGQLATSANYSNGGSAGGVTGIATAATPAETNDGGYIGQLYEVTGLALTAPTSIVVETTSTLQLSASETLDDGTTIAVPATAVAWSIRSGPITSISSGGVLTAGTVSLDTSATVEGGYDGNTGLLNLTVLVAIEGWRLTYFGTTSNAGNAADTSAPAADGIPNLVKYALGLNPLVSFSPATALPTPLVGSANSLLDDRLAISFTLPNPAPVDVTYAVQATADMADWTTVATKAGTGDWTWNAGGTSHIVESDGLHSTSMQVGDNVASSGNPRRMMRLQVTGP